MSVPALPPPPSTAARQPGRLASQDKAEQLRTLRGLLLQGLARLQSESSIGLRLSCRKKGRMEKGAWCRAATRNPRSRGRQPREVREAQREKGTGASPPLITAAEAAGGHQQSRRDLWRPREAAMHLCWCTERSGSCHRSQAPRGTPQALSTAYTALGGSHLRARSPRPGPATLS